VGVARGGRRSFAENPLSRSEGGFRRKNAWQAGRGERPGRLEPVTARGSERQPRGGCRSRPRAGLRLHPGVRHGATRRRRCEWEQPHYFSWRPAWAGDAEWMFGKSRTRLAPGLDKGFLMDVGPEQLTQIGLRPPVDHTPVFSQGENAIAKEPGSSYPERWPGCVLTRRFNGGLGSSGPSPNHTLSWGAFSASSQVTPICADTSRDRVVPACNSELYTPADSPAHRLARGGTADPSLSCSLFSPVSRALP
jgi:hypothetical protein